MCDHRTGQIEMLGDEQSTLGDETEQSKVGIVGWIISILIGLAGFAGLRGETGEAGLLGSSSQLSEPGRVSCLRFVIAVLRRARRSTGEL